MTLQHWVPVAAFLGVSIPVVLLLDTMQFGGEYRLWIAIAAGALASAFAQSRVKRQGEQE